MMIKTKILESSRKSIFPKPSWSRPKWKSYKELLGTQKPKKKQLVESDGENDDFL